MPAKERSAKTMQEQSMIPAPYLKREVTLRLENGYEYHVSMPPDELAALLDPDVPDCFIEVPPIASGASGQRLQGVRRYLHTGYIKEVDVRS